jgi:hypothetical protein
MRERIREGYDKSLMSWQYTDGEYVKVFRKMLEWEWYTDVNTTKLFLHCLLKANWRDGTWRGYKYKRGQFITSLPTLARETGMTIKEVRTALNHLKRTGEVADWHDSKIRVITVLSYDQFQQRGRPTGSQRAGKGQTEGSQRAADIRSIRSKEDKEDNTPTAVFGDDDTDEAEGWGFE